MTIKSELRRDFLGRQKSLSQFERRQKSESIAGNFFRSFDLNRIKFLHCFLPIEKFNEIDTKPIFQRVWREFPRIITIVPRVNFQKNEIENVRFSEVTKLVQNIWQIDEPSHNELIETKNIDAVLVPLLAFDKDGFRAGYGKGFYDKFLSECRKDCLKIGLSYFAPVNEISDAQSFDAPLDFCVTPEEIFTAKARKRTQRFSQTRTK
ncbi:MAG: 5-formyltetrahydrofolate cyclo-ligase [Pyrinomonadaceae bacterium]